MNEVKTAGKNSLLPSLPSAMKLRQGNIFTSVCKEFCPGGGVCLSVCWDTPPGRHPPTRQTPRLDRHPPMQTPPDQTPPSQTPPRADTPPGQTPSSANGYCSRRYASYWNAFLSFSNKFIMALRPRRVFYRDLVEKQESIPEGSYYPNANLR